MKILTLDRMFRLRSKILLKPHVRYVLSEMEAVPLYQTEIHRWGDKEVFKHCSASCFQSYERRYGGQNANGKKILLYRHYAYGDSLIATAVPRYIKTLYPHCEITLYTHPEMFNFWRGNKFITDELAVPLPIPFEATKHYDYHILYEGMLEGNSEPDQNNCYDDMFSFCGLHEVPDRFKRPYIFLWGGDYAAVEYLKLDLNCDYLVYHLTPANENRCYPLKLARVFWEMFLKSFPEWKIFVVGLDPEGERGGMFDGLPEDRCINLLSKFKDFRHLIPILEKAGLVVCPDSAIGHLAACFPHVPVISLWGLFSPNDRVKYYGNHYPLWHPEVCPHAPCHNHEFVIPECKCKDAETYEYTKKLSPLYSQFKKATGVGLQWCPVLAAITPEEILGLADKIIVGGFQKQQRMKTVADKENIMPRLSKKEAPTVNVEEVMP